MAYECLNPRCPQYAGNGVRLGINDVRVDAQRRLHCGVCQSFVRAAAPREDDGNGKRVAGTTGGALLGWAVGGPAGALVGGFLGFLLGDNSAERGK